MTLKYREYLKDLNNVELGHEDLEYTVPWFNEIFTPNRDSLQEFLKNNNIGSRTVYPEINKQKIYFENAVLENSSKISAQVFGYRHIWEYLTDILK